MERLPPFRIIIRPQSISFFGLKATNHLWLKIVFVDQICLFQFESVDQNCLFQKKGHSYICSLTGNLSIQQVFREL